MRRAELVVVAEAGDPARRARRILEHTLHVHGLPALLSVTEAHAGAALSLSAALGAARSDRALLMGADILPQRQGWLTDWIRAMRSDRNDLVGGTLLAVDGSVLHAGGRLRPNVGHDPLLLLQRKCVAERDLPSRRQAKSELLSADCAALGRRAIDAFMRLAPTCPDPDVILSFLAVRSGEGRVRFGSRFVRYATDSDDAGLLDAVRPHVLALLLELHPAG